MHSTHKSGRDFICTNLGTIRQIAQTEFAKLGMPHHELDDFVSSLHIKLLENDGARLRRCAGARSTRSFLRALVRNHALDYRIHRWGKWRPSTRAARLGDLAVSWERLTHRDELPDHEAERLLEGRGFGTAAIERTVALLRRREPRRRQVSIRFASDRPGATLNPETLAQASRLQRALEGALRSLTPRQRRILRARFGLGKTVADLAAELECGVQPLYREIAKLIGLLRERLAESGIRNEDLRNALDHRTALPVRWRYGSIATSRRLDPKDDGPPRGSGSETWGRVRSRH